MEITKGENANLAGMEPRCPECSAKVEFVMLSDSAAGIAAMCANDHRFPLYKGLYDCHVFFRTPVLRCPCCESENVTLEQNEIARWVACHNPKCGLTHHVSTNPELAQFFRSPAPTPPLDVKWEQDAFVILAALKESVIWELAPSIMTEIRRLVEEFPRRHIASPAQPLEVDEVDDRLEVLYEAEEMEPVRKWRINFKLPDGARIALVNFYSAAQAMAQIRGMLLHAKRESPAASPAQPEKPPKCWKCAAKLPHEWQFCEAAPPQSGKEGQ